MPTLAGENLDGIALGGGPLNKGTGQLPAQAVEPHQVRPVPRFCVVNQSPGYATGDRTNHLRYFRLWLWNYREGAKDLDPSTLTITIPNIHSEPSPHPGGWASSGYRISPKSQAAGKRA